MNTAHNLQESPLQRYLRERAMYYHGGNLGRISLTDAGRTRADKKQMGIKFTGLQ